MLKGFLEPLPGDFIQWNLHTYVFLYINYDIIHDNTTVYL